MLFLTGIVIVILLVIVCVVNVIKKQKKNGQENNQGHNFNFYHNQGAEINIDGSDCNHRSL